MRPARAPKGPGRPFSSERSQVPGEQWFRQARTERQGGGLLLLLLGDLLGRCLLLLRHSDGSLRRVPEHRTHGRSLGHSQEGTGRRIVLEGFPTRVNRSPAEPGRRTAPASTKPFPSMSFRVDITPQPDPLQSLRIISMSRFVDQRIRCTNHSSTMHRNIA